MLSAKVLSNSIPGFTGHQPGYSAENLHGHSYGYLTERRRDLITTQRDDDPISKYRSDFVAKDVNPPSPYKAVREESAKRPRSFVLPILDLKAVVDRSTITLADGNPLCRMPGYTGHIPHAQIEENLGLSFARTTRQGYLSARGTLVSDATNSNTTTRRFWSAGGGTRRSAQEQEKSKKKEQVSELGPTRNISTPIVGYAGFIPNYKDTDPSLHYRNGLQTARTMKPDEDEMNVGMTPSMREAALGENNIPTGSLTARPPASARAYTASGRPNRAVVVMTREEKSATQPDRKSGYTGFKPQPPKSPEVYTKCKGANAAGLYFGDLTQYWNGQPYKTTYQASTDNIPRPITKITPRRW